MNDWEKAAMNNWENAAMSDWEKGWRSGRLQQAEGKNGLQTQRAQKIYLILEFQHAGSQINFRRVFFTLKCPTHSFVGNTNLGSHYIYKHDFSHICAANKQRRF